MHTENNKKAGTKQKLMDAFWELYTVKRIEKITVKEITMKAGVNRGTFYEYFMDVYDVLEQIEESLIPDIHDLPPFQIDNKNFGMPADMFLKLFGSREKYYRVLLGENGDPSFIRKSKDSIKSAIMKTLIGNNSGDNRKLDFVLEYTLSAMLGVMHYWFDNKNSLSAEELIELTSDLMDNGVASHYRSL